MDFEFSFLHQQSITSYSIERKKKSTEASEISSATYPACWIIHLRFPPGPCCLGWLHWCWTKGVSGNQLWSRLYSKSRGMKPLPSAACSYGQWAVLHPCGKVFLLCFCTGLFISAVNLDLFNMEVYEVWLIDPRWPCCSFWLSAWSSFPSALEVVLLEEVHVFSQMQQHVLWITGGQRSGFGVMCSRADTKVVQASGIKKRKREKGLLCGWTEPLHSTGEEHEDKARLCVR